MRTTMHKWILYKKMHKIFYLKYCWKRLGVIKWEIENLMNKIWFLLKFIFISNIQSCQDNDLIHCHYYGQRQVHDQSCCHYQGQLQGQCHVHILKCIINFEPNLNSPTKCYCPKMYVKIIQLCSLQIKFYIIFID